MKKIVGILAGGLLAMSAAQADTVSFSAATTGDPSTDWTKTLSLQQFNSALGTLTSVVFNYGGTFTSIFQEENLANAAATITINTAGNLVFGLPISTTTLSFSSSASRLVQAFDLSKDSAGTSGFVSLPLPAGGSGTSATITSSPVLATFIGLATFDIPVAANASSNASSTGDFASQINTTADAKITVTYTYVPEPGSLALVGFALAGLGLVRRKPARA